MRIGVARTNLNLFEPSDSPLTRVSQEEHLSVFHEGITASFVHSISSYYTWARADWNCNSKIKACAQAYLMITLGAYIHHAYVTSGFESEYYFMCSVPFNNHDDWSMGSYLNL